MLRVVAAMLDQFENDIAAIIRCWISGAQAIIGLPRVRPSLSRKPLIHPPASRTSTIPANTSQALMVSVALRPLGRMGHFGARSVDSVVLERPGQQFLDPALRPAIDQAGQHLAEIALRIEAIELAGLDQRRNGGPMLTAFIASGKE